MSEVNDVVVELQEEAMRLSRRSIDRGCVDSWIASNLAGRAADLIAHQAARLEEVTRERDEARGDLAWWKSESARRLACMDRRADRIIELTDALEAKGRELAEAKAECDGMLSTWAESRKRHLSAEASLTAAEAEKERYRAALAWYSDCLCEHSIDFEGCGKLSDDDCAGCRARAVLSPKKEQADV